MEHKMAVYLETGTTLTTLNLHDETGYHSEPFVEPVTIPESRWWGVSVDDDNNCTLTPISAAEAVLPPWRSLVL